MLIQLRCDQRKWKLMNKVHNWSHSLTLRVKQNKISLQQSECTLTGVGSIVKLGANYWSDTIHHSNVMRVNLDIKHEAFKIIPMLLGIIGQRYGPNILSLNIPWKE